MKSSRSSSQLTDGGAADGVVWLDEPLGFPFLSFLILGSCTGGWTSCVGGHGLGGMKSSMSSSQLTQVCAAGGATWLDEPLAFPFVYFLILGSCTGGGTSCVGGHSLGGMKSSMSSSQLTQVGGWGAEAWLDEPPGICSCAGQVLSPEDLIHLLRLVCGISPPKIHTNLQKFGIDLLINSVSSG